MLYLWTNSSDYLCCHMVSGLYSVPVMAMGTLGALWRKNMDLYVVVISVTSNIVFINSIYRRKSRPR